MKRVILTAPQGLLIAGMNADEQSKIAEIFSDLVVDVPATKLTKGKILIDALAPDDFDEAALTLAFPTIEVIGVYSWDGVSDTLTEIKALDTAKYKERLSDIKTFDDQGVELTSVAPPLYSPHEWAGRPSMI